MTNDSFTVFPAMDLRGGKVVRLAQGDPQRQTTYSDEPLHWAERWKSEGAEWLHMVNLDGAFGEDTHRNLDALERLLPLGLKIELGGGIRDRASIRQLLELGLERVFLGTAAVQDSALIEWAVAAYGPVRIAADIGASAGKVRIKGWQESTGFSVLQLGQMLRRQGLEWCVLTDVSRDGTCVGIDLTSAMELQSATGLRVVASGGVSRLEQVRSARLAGLAGIIIGRALYDGNLSLRDCMTSVSI